MNHRPVFAAAAISLFTLGIAANSVQVSRGQGMALGVDGRQAKLQFEVRKITGTNGIQVQGGADFQIIGSRGIREGVVIELPSVRTADSEGQVAKFEGLGTLRYFERQAPDRTGQVQIVFTDTRRPDRPTEPADRVLIRFLERNRQVYVFEGEMSDGDLSVTSQTIPRN